MKKYTLYFTAAFLVLFGGFFFLTKFMSEGRKVSGSVEPIVVQSANSPAVASPVTAATTETAKAESTAATADSSVAPANSSTTPLALPSALPSEGVISLGEIFAATPLQQLETAERKILFSNKGGCIRSAELLNFKENGKSQNSANSVTNYLDCALFGVKFGAFDFRSAEAFLASHTPKSRTLVLKQGDFVLTKEFIFESGNYTGKLNLKLENKSAQAISAPLGIELGVHSEQKGSGGLLNSIPMELTGLVYENSEKVKRNHVTFVDAPVPESLLSETAQPISWAGSETTYFLNALAPVQKGFFDLKLNRTGHNVQPSATSALVRNVTESWLEQTITMQPGSTFVLELDSYVGPKSKTELDALTTKNSKVNLVPAIDYGMFRIVAWPIYKALGFFHGLTGNWGWAIILLTLGIKILFIPLMAKAFSSGKKMQEIQPELNALKEKYKDDKQTQQKELMALMSKRGVNPMSGCLPILPQIPVFFGLNAVLTHTFELRLAPFAGWIADLASKDPYYISPAAMAVLMFVQQKLTPMPSMEPAQQKMMQWMPVIFAVFMLAYPSGLVLYIMTNTIVTVLQQQYMIKSYDSSQKKNMSNNVANTK